MARLLVLLACARGAAGIMDALDIKAVCEVPADAVAHPRVLRVRLSTPDPTRATMLARSPICARYESRRSPHRLS